MGSMQERIDIYAFRSSKERLSEALGSLALVAISTISIDSVSRISVGSGVRCTRQGASALEQKPYDDAVTEVETLGICQQGVPDLHTVGERKACTNTQRFTEPGRRQRDEPMICKDFREERIVFFQKLGRASYACCRAHVAATAPPTMLCHKARQGPEGICLGICEIRLVAGSHHEEQ